MGELTHTVIGNPTVFKSADKSEIKSLKVYFNPVQRGDGDPSPSNIKTISGWNEVQYFKLKNPLQIVPINFSPMEGNGGTLDYLGNNTFSLSGTLTSNTTFTMPIQPITYKNDYTYYKVMIVESFGSGVFNIQSIGLGFKHNNVTKQSLILTPADRYMAAAIRSYGKWSSETEEMDTFIITFRSGWSNAKIKLFITESETESSTISFDNNIYGGYIDLISGKLIQTHTKFVEDGSVNTNTWTYTKASFGTYYEKPLEYLETLKPKYGYQKCVFNYLNSPLSGQSWQGAVGVDFNSTTGNPAQNMLRLILPKEDFSSINDLLSYLSEHPLEIVYELATPIEYQLTPQQIQTFLGENCFLAASNGDIEVEYAFTDHLAKRKLILNEPHIETVSGTLNSFNTDISTSFKGCKVGFFPAQDEYAIPSSTNIKPITGWTGIQLLHNSLIPIDLQGFTTGQLGTSNGVINYLGDNTYEFIGTPEDTGSVIIPIKPITFAANTAYHVMVIKEPENGIGSANTALNIAFKTETGSNIFVCRPNYIGWSNYVCRAYATPNNNLEAVSFAIGISTGSSSFKFKFFLSLDIFAIDTRTWGTDYGVIYGGYLDFINHKIIQTYDCINTTWGDYNRSYDQISGGNQRFTNYERRIFTFDKDFKPNNSEINYYCNVAKCNNSGYDDDAPFFVMGNSMAILKLPIETDDNLPIQIVGELKTPIIHNLTMNPLSKQIKGINNFWSNTNGPIEIKYWTH